MAAAMVRAQAKVNLFLRVVGREASGYHHIETLYCRVGLADVVTVSLTRASRSLDCTGPELPPRGLGSVGGNLAWRAAVEYAALARWPAGFEIALEKHIPVRAGLGGGSADAAAVLRALNALNPRPLDREPLERVAASLGADVPFLAGQAPLALGLGRGDRCRALPALPTRPCIVAWPSVGVSTADAYRWVDEARGWTGREIEAGRQDAEGLRDAFTWRDVRHVAHNDFQAVVFARVPDVAATWTYLRGIVGTLGFALMSGSGSAVFAILDVADVRSRSLPTAPAGVRTTVTETVERVESVQLID